MKFLKIILFAIVIFSSNFLIAQENEGNKAELQLKKMLGISHNNVFKVRANAIVFSKENGTLKSLGELPESFKKYFDPKILSTRKAIIINNETEKETAKKRNEQLLQLIQISN